MNPFKHYFERHTGIYVLTVLSIVVLFSSLAFADSCSDTDGGIVYTQKGIVEVKDTDGNVISTDTDQCEIFDVRLLAEYYCDSDVVKVKTYTCPTPCDNGKCDPAPDTCSYYDYDFFPPAGPLDGCDTGFTCCMDACLACGTDRTLCCSVDGDDGDCCDATEVCDEDKGKCIKVNCDDPTDPNYCTICDFCYDSIRNCGEACIDGGGFCVSGSEYTAGVYPVIDVFGIEGSLLTDYLVEDVEIYYSDIFRCFDGLDNDYDCLIDSADPDCSFILPPGACIDSDGDGYGLGSGCLGADCDDTDPAIWINCDTTPPQVNITIDNNDTYANKLSVTLNLQYSDDISLPAQLRCRFSDDNITYTPWDACTPSKTWVLSGPDGTNTVYIDVKDAQGNINDTESDSIILDTTPPLSDTRVIPDPSQSFANVTFETTCLDSISGCDSTIIDIYSDTCIINHGGTAINCTLKLPFQCEDNVYIYSANTKDIAGNLNKTDSTFTVKKMDGCSCIMSDECFSLSCIANEICSPQIPPEISFASAGSFEIPLGNTEIIVLRLKNPMSIQDSIKLSIYTDPSVMQQWSYFEGERYTENHDTKTIQFGPQSEQLVPLYIYGGKTGTYRLTIDAESLTTSQRSYNKTTLSVVLKEKDGIDSTTPGMHLIGILIILIFATFIATKRITDSHA